MLKAMFLVISILSFDGEGKISAETTLKPAPNMYVCMLMSAAVEAPPSGSFIKTECVEVIFPKKRGA